MPRYFILIWSENLFVYIVVKPPSFVLANFRWDFLMAHRSSIKHSTVDCSSLSCSVNSLSQDHSDFFRVTLGSLLASLTNAFLFQCLSFGKWPLLVRVVFFTLLHKYTKYIKHIITKLVDKFSYWYFGLGARSHELKLPWA